MIRVARSAYNTLYWLPFLGIVGLALLVSAAAGGAYTGVPAQVLQFLGLVFLIWLFLGRRIALALVPLLVTKLTCPNCRQTLPTVGVWNCGCGFHDHRQTNVLTKRCPKCGEGAGHLNCPRCDCTILLW